MSVIRVVWGTASGPTELAAYDAALGEAGVGDYNLVTLSSVIPAGPILEVVGEAPDLGPPGEELRVVQSKAVASPAGSDGDRGETVAAGIGWARSEEGPGIFYEVAGADAERVRAEIETGLDAGKAQRDWSFVDEEVVVGEATAGTTGADDAYAAAVVQATYGESRPLL